MKSPKKILFVVYNLSFGGAERVLLNLLKKLDRDLFKPTVAVIGDGNDYKEDMPDDVKVFHLNRRSCYDPRVLYRIWSIIRTEKIDTMVSFITRSSAGLFVIKVFLRKPVTIILTIHGHLSRFIKGDDSLKGKSKSSLNKLLIKIFYPMANKLVAVSSGVKEDLFLNFGIPKEKTVVIGNPVDLDRIHGGAKDELKDLYFLEDLPVIISCGRLASVKNYSLLLRAMKIVMQEVDLKLVLIGDGRELNKLTQLSEEINISKDVSFLGYKSNPFKYISRADIFVLPSDNEGFGNVIVESMACGTPVISTRTVGAEEIITDGLNGILTAIDDVNEMAEAILKLVKSQSLREGFVREGYRRAEDFRQEKIITEYEKVLMV